MPGPPAAPLTSAAPGLSCAGFRLRRNRWLLAAKNLQEAALHYARPPHEALAGQGKAGAGGGAGADLWWMSEACVCACALNTEHAHTQVDRRALQHGKGKVVAA